MGPDLTVDDVAGILDQLYRGAKEGRAADGDPPDARSIGSAAKGKTAKTTDAGGVPRRFYVSRRYQDLRNFIGRTHALRSDFLEHLGQSLEYEFGILMSLPRVPKEGGLAFASFRVVESWRPVPASTLQATLSEAIQGDPVHVARARLERLYEINHGDPAHLTAIVLTGQQLCQLTEHRSFDEKWWFDILNKTGKRPEFKLVFFCYEVIPERFIAITREDHIINKWRRAVLEDWRAALKRYHLDEIDEAAEISGSNEE